MLFKEFINAPGLSLILPSDIVHGEIVDIKYRQNPIQLDIKTPKGIFHAKFSNRFLYDKIVGKQKPEIGKKAYIHLNHKNHIQSIEIN